MNTNYLINFIMSARDNTAGAFEKLKGQVGGLQTQWSTLHSLITTGVIGGFAALIAHSIELGDKLWTLHERTGISVQSLGGLSLSAEQSGTSIEALMKGSKHLGELMTDALVNPTGEAGSAFSKLGLSIKDAHGNLLPFDQMLPQIADKMNTYKDGMEKSQAINYLFSRSGAEISAMLKMGGDEIAKNIDLYQKLGGHTMESAQAADAFGDKMKVVKLASEGVWNTIATALLPTMNKLADEYIKAQLNSDKYNTAATITTNLVKILATVFYTLLEAANGAGNLLAAFAAALVAGFNAAVDESIAKAKAFGEMLIGIGLSMSGNYLEGAKHFQEGLDTLNTQAEGSSKKASEAVSTIWSSYREQSEKDFVTYQGRISKLWDDTGTEIEAKSGKIGQQIAAPVLKAAKEVKESDFDKALRKFTDNYNEALLQMAGGFNDVTKSEKDFLELVNKPEWAKLSTIEQQIISDAFGVANAQEHTNIMMKAFNQLAGEAADKAKAFKDEQEAWKGAINDNALAFEGIIKSVKDQTEGLKFEGIEHDKYLARLALEKDWYAGLIPTAEEYQARLKRISDVYSELGDAQKLKELTDRNMTMFQDLEQGAHGFFDSIFEKGSDTFKNLGAMLKKYLLDLLYQATVKQWLISLGVSSGMVTSAGAAALNAAGGGGLGGAAQLGSSAFSASSLSNLGSLFSGESILSAAASGAAAMGWGTLGVNAAAGLGEGTIIGLGAGEAAGAGLAGGLSGAAGAAAAVPVIGWVIAAAAILYAMFGNKGGGPKAGGFSQSGGGGFSRFFTPSQADVSLNNVTSQFQDSYKNIVEGLGGQVISDLGFAIGYDTDPNGTAENRVSGGVSAGGRTIWQSLNQTAGRDDKDLQTVMDRTMATAMAQAIKSSNLTGVVAAVWRDVATVTGEQLRNLVEFSAQLHNMEVNAKADILVDAKNVESAAQASAIDKYRTAAQQVRDLAASYDGSAAATSRLSQATTQFRQLAIQLIVAIDGIADSFRKTIAESKRNVEMTGLEGDPLRAYLQNEIDRLLNEMTTTTDPQKVQELGNKINQDILQMWGTLDPEVQTKQKDSYLSWFDTIGTAVQTRLDALKAVITGDGSDSYTNTMKDVSQAMLDAADGITAAANLIATAASTMNNAADNIANGNNITITVNTQTGEVGVSGQ